jgi:Outer membrane protein beta-barrel domain
VRKVAHSDFKIQIITLHILCLYTKISFLRYTFWKKTFLDAICPKVCKFEKMLLMKNLIIALTIFLSLPSLAQRQFVGIKAGPNVSTMFSPFDHLSDLSRFGIVGGLTYDYQTSKRFSFGADLLYFQKGYRDALLWTDENGNFLGKGTFKYNYDYLSLPLKVGMVFGEEFSGFFNLGIVPSLLINAKTHSFALPGFSEETTFNNMQNATRLDLGGLVELGANYRLNSNYLLFATLGYQQGINTVSNSNHAAYLELRNYSLALCFGLKYALKKSE